MALQDSVPYVACCAFPEEALHHRHMLNRQHGELLEALLHHTRYEGPRGQTSSAWIQHHGKVQLLEGCTHVHCRAE